MSVCKRELQISLEHDIKRDVLMRDSKVGNDLFTRIVFRIWQQRLLPSGLGDGQLFVFETKTEKKELITLAAFRRNSKNY